MKKLRAGVIGLGRSGYDIHVHSMSRLPDLYEIAAVADPLADRVSEAVNAHGCKGFDDYRKMLDAGDLDIVVCATPSHLHVPVTLDVMKRGFNVLCDKPFARKAEEVDTLAATSKSTGKKLFVYTVKSMSLIKPAPGPPLSKGRGI